MTAKIIRRKRNVLLVFALLLSLSLGGCRSEKFDADEYVRAILALDFQGVTDDARNFNKEASVDMLKGQYISFVDQVTELLTMDLELSEEQRQEYADVVSKIFLSAQYDVGEATKSDGDTYDVPVTIWPSDVLLQYKKLMTQDSLALVDRVKKGEISGTEEEIAEKITEHIKDHAAELLEQAWSSCSYGDEEVVHLTLRKEKDEYYIDPQDMTLLIKKIIQFDAVSE